MVRRSLANLLYAGDGLRAKWQHRADRWSHVPEAPRPRLRAQLDAGYTHLVTYVDLVGTGADAVRGAATCCALTASSLRTATSTDPPTSPPRTDNPASPSRSMRGGAPSRYSSADGAADLLPCEPAVRDHPPGPTATHSGGTNCLNELCDVIRGKTCKRSGFAFSFCCLLNAFREDAGSEEHPKFRLLVFVHRVSEGRQG